jgi:cell division protease FtsH
MSPIVGRVSLLPGPGDEQVPFTPSPISEETHTLVDDEVRRIVDECYAEAVSLLRAHRHNVDALAEALLAKETLDESEAYAIAGIRSPSVVPDPVR